MILNVAKPFGFPVLPLNQKNVHVVIQKVSTRTYFAMGKKKWLNTVHKLYNKTATSS